jgi:hypothetical protein
VLYPYVLFSEPRTEVSSTLLQHELIHVRQVRSNGWLRFYAQYLREYFSLRLSGSSGEEAYRNISFEKEAYAFAGQIVLSEAEKVETGLA